MSRIINQPLELSFEEPSFDNLVYQAPVSPQELREFFATLDVTEKKNDFFLHELAGLELESFNPFKFLAELSISDFDFLETENILPVFIGNMSAKIADTGLLKAA